MGLDFEPWEPEESVGKLWHAFASRLGAGSEHADAAVRLGEVEGRLAVFFRALGGPRDAGIHPAAREAVAARRSFGRRLATVEDRLCRPSYDGEGLRLPPVLAVFPDRAANAALYFWLAAAAAHAAPPPAERDPLRADLLALRAADAMTRATLADCPGLTGFHALIAAAALAARPARLLPATEAAVEGALRALLGATATDEAARLLGGVRRGDTLDEFVAPKGYRPFAPCPLWPDLRPADARAGAAEAEDAEPAPGAQIAAEGVLKARRRAADQAERRDSLILHKFEALLSWAEFLNINRRVEDDDPEGARKAAEDANELSLTQIAKRAATRLRMAIELSPLELARDRLAGEHVYPEWDSRAGAYLPDHCRVFAALAEPAAEPPAFVADPAARRRILAVKRQFEALRPARMMAPRQIDGDELDLDAVVRARLALRAHGEGSDRVWRASRRAERSLSVSILLDISRSTESVVSGARTVIDVEREALAALARGLDACGDESAVRAFCSLRRDRVWVREVKGFDERMGPVVDARIAGLSPGHYTRLGCAIRHVSGELGTRARAKRLLLVITDGKPNDIDHYEGRHGVEDSRMAVHEARRRGQAVHGVIVNDRGQGWFGRIFGRGGYSVISDAEKLTAALAELYRNLVGG